MQRGGGRSGYGKCARRSRGRRRKSMSRRCLSRRRRKQQLRGGVVQLRTGMFVKLTINPDALASSGEQINNIYRQLTAIERDGYLPVRNDDSTYIILYFSNVNDYEGSDVVILNNNDNIVARYLIKLRDDDSRDKYILSRLNFQLTNEVREVITKINKDDTIKSDLESKLRDSRLLIKSTETQEEREIREQREIERTRQTEAEWWYR